MYSAPRRCIETRKDNIFHCPWCCNCKPDRELLYVIWRFRLTRYGFVLAKSLAMCNGLLKYLLCQQNSLHINDLTTAALEMRFSDQQYMSWFIWSNPKINNYILALGNFSNNIFIILVMVCVCWMEKVQFSPFKYSQSMNNPLNSNLTQFPP